MLTHLSLLSDETGEADCNHGKYWEVTQPVIHQS